MITINVGHGKFILKTKVNWRKKGDYWNYNIPVRVVGLSSQHTEQKGKIVIRKYFKKKNCYYTLSFPKKVTIMENK